MFLQHMLSMLKARRKQLAILFLLAVLLVAALNFWMVRAARPVFYSNTAAIPANDVGLVLGSSATLPNGQTNLHLIKRLDAAVQLYREGKIKRLLLSGDNSRPSYDEPTDMKNALVKRGIPESAMVLDYAGFRTLDSLARANLIFGQRKLTIITEEFHGARCVFLARHFGMDPVVYCAEGLPLRWSLRSSVREVAARVAAVLDACVFQRGPKYLGQKVAMMDRR